MQRHPNKALTLKINVVYNIILCRHPETAPRPAFQDIVLTLVGSDKMVLLVPSDALEGHPQAGEIGAPVEAGAKMYQDLCKQYCNS